MIEVHATAKHFHGLSDVTVADPSGLQIRFAQALA